MIAVVQTMICQDCRDVVDVVIEEMVGGVPIRVLALDDDWDSCPQCDGKKVVVWDESRPCPRCDGQMTQNESIVINWD